MLRYLIDAGADIEATDLSELNILHVAANGTEVSVIRFLVNDMHCDPKGRCKFGMTPLHLAAAWGRVEIVQELCRLGGHNTLRADFLQVAVAHALT
jgi:ankyrin repeat protein